MTALLVPINSIIVKSNRQRREFDLGPLEELKESMQRRAGLQNAPVVRFESGETVLVSGERRLRAARDLHDLGLEFRYGGAPVPVGLMPVVPIGELSELEAEEAELDENLRRTDLTWQEKAMASARLMRLREKQADAAGKPGPTVADITREVRPDASTFVGEAHTATRNEILVARHLADPEVAKAKTIGDAVKILKKREEVTLNQMLAATVGASFGAHSHQLLNADCLEWLATTAPGQFDIILSDPPYGMGADEFGDSGQGPSAGAHFYKDDYETWKQLMGLLPALLFRAAKAEAHAYLFCDLDRFADLRQVMTFAGWKVHRTPLVWHNPDGFRAPWPEQGPQRQYELVLYAVKGDRKTTKLASDVLSYRRDASLGHPAQKPVALLRDLLSRSARPGDRVLDAFAGSGSTVAACHEMKLPCTGLELDAGAYGIAVKRLQGLAAFETELPL